MMSEGNGLSPLQVGVTGHNGVAVFFRFLRDHPYQVGHELFDGFNFLFEIQLDVYRYLIVAAARGVEPLAVVAYALGQLALDKGVDILSLGVDRQLAAFDVGLYFFQPLNDVLRAFFADYSAASQHICVSYAALDVLAVHSAVKGD